MLNEVYIDLSGIQTQLDLFILMDRTKDTQTEDVGSYLACNIIKNQIQSQNEIEIL